MNFMFLNGEILDLKDFKGPWTHENIEKHFGSEIAQRIMQENPINRLSEKCKKF